MAMNRNKRTTNNPNISKIAFGKEKSRKEMTEKRKSEQTGQSEQSEQPVSKTDNSTSKGYKKITKSRSKNKKGTKEKSVNDFNWIQRLLIRIGRINPEKLKKTNDDSELNVSQSDSEPTISILQESVIREEDNNAELSSIIRKCFSKLQINGETVCLTDEVEKNPELLWETLVSHIEKFKEHYNPERNDAPKTISFDPNVDGIVIPTEKEESGTSTDIHQESAHDEESKIADAESETKESAEPGTIVNVSAESEIKEETKVESNTDIKHASAPENVSEAPNISDETTIKDLKNQIRDLNKRLKEAEKDLTNANSELNKKKLKIEALERDRSPKEEVVSKKEYDDLKKELDKSKEEVENQGNALTTLKNEKVDLKATLDEKQNKLNEKIEELEEVHEKLKKIEASEIGALNNELQARNAEIKSLTEEKKQLVSDIKSQDDRIAILQKKKKQLEDEKKQKETEISTLNSDLDKERQKNKDSQNDLKEKNKSLKIVKENLAQSEKQIIDQKEKIGDLTKKNSDLKSANEILEGEKNRLEKNLNEEKKNFADLNNNFEQQKTTLEEKELQLNSAKLEHDKNINDYHDKIMHHARAVLDILEKGGYEIGAGAIGDQCADDETTNRNMFRRLIEKLETISSEERESVKTLNDKIYKELLMELDEGSNGVFASLGRLCGYNRMPFIRDNNGLENIRLNFPVISRLEYHLTGLLGSVGIRLIIPIPYSDILNEGEFEDATGSISNLEYMVPNTRQHLNKVDRAAKEDIITDIVAVGYILPNGTVIKAKVLI